MIGMERRAYLELNEFYRKRLPLSYINCKSSINFSIAARSHNNIKNVATTCVYVVANTADSMQSINLLVLMMVYVPAIMP